ncbi:MAG: phosphate/phosphite/phosphonate ABC transporter substrate-binding protein [Myxococcota bacterium]|nr:phosphate/phosphite/phosphonate ABC transporter substrate-binding protein [Myxococcota bacterium]MDW8363222.1 PhnD/SsuA/transferrin family substrate-binding protein [Myxococcales bacterium]
MTTTIVFGMGPVALSAARAAARVQFGEALGRALGRPVVVHAADSYSELARWVQAGRVTLAWMPPALAVRALDAGDATPLVASVRRDGARFRGVLFVLDDSSIRDLAEARGRRVAWVDAESCSGYLFPRLAMRERGLSPAGFFRNERFAGSHNAVVRAVALRKVEVGATFLDERPGGERRPGWTLEVDAAVMRPLLVTDFIPADVVSAIREADPQLVRDAGAALRSMHEEPEAAASIATVFGAHRFEPADPEALAPVRRALETA